MCANPQTVLGEGCMALAPGRLSGLTERRLAVGESKNAPKDAVHGFIRHRQA
jgi:hypothetical protein